MESVVVRGMRRNGRQERSVLWAKEARSEVTSYSCEVSDHESSATLGGET